MADNVVKNTTPATPATPTTPAWQTNKNYNYSTYSNFKPEDLSGLSKNEMASAYKPLLTSINKDISQATKDYNAAVKSGNLANIQAAKSNLTAQKAELAQYKTDYNASLASLKKPVVKKAEGGLISLLGK